jgi:hypothetical protein
MACLPPNHWILNTLLFYKVGYGYRNPQQWAIHHSAPFSAMTRKNKKINTQTGCG